MTPKLSPQARATADAFEELQNATATFPPFHSAHEGYAVIKEELDELWEEVRKKASSRTSTSLRTEAIQVAAMALRFAAEITP